MAYRVNITARAERDFTCLFERIHAEHSDAAMMWYRGLKVAVLSLEKLPHRCPVIRKKDQLSHLLYGRKPHVYRVIYRVLENKKQVDVLHIRHGARRKFKASDLG